MERDEILLRAGRALDNVRARRPLVLCLTNTVVENWTANCLLALGAVPAMMSEPEEAAELAAVSGAVLVNVGTVTRAQAETMRAAIAACSRHGVPWVLDPVAADKLAYRRGLVAEFIKGSPRLVRGNAGEIAALRGLLGDTVALATGAVDEIGGLRLANGVPLLQRVTGTGCAQGALAAAFCAVEPDPVVAGVAAALAMALAGERAVEVAARPGAFQTALLDALDALTARDFQERAKWA